MVASKMNGTGQKQLTKGLEKIFEEASFSGELKLCNQKLKEFPIVDIKVKSSDIKFNLKDTIVADLSKNRFTEFPEELFEFTHLEKLYLYYNTIKSVPKTVAIFQSLNYLDLSRNQLIILPREICRLPLHTLIVAHNKLVSLPDELGRMSVLVDFDACCNRITELPSKLDDLSRLKYLNLRSNLLIYIPIELTYLKLIRLDISKNRISILPNELRKMKSLVDLEISDNPLTSPPAELCTQGRMHIFKYLERLISNPQPTPDNYSQRINKISRSRKQSFSSKDVILNRQIIDDACDSSCEEKKNSAEEAKNLAINLDSFIEKNGLEVLNRLLSTFTPPTEKKLEEFHKNSSAATQDYLLSSTLFVIFVSTLAFLYFYPIPT